MTRRMNDNDGAPVAEAIYTRLFGGGNPSVDPAAIAYALDEVVRTLKKQGLPPERWAPFIHIGV